MPFTIFFLILPTHGSHRTLNPPTQYHPCVWLLPLRSHSPYSQSLTLPARSLPQVQTPAYYEIFLLHDTFLSAFQLYEICEAKAFQKEHLLQRNASQIITYQPQHRRIPLPICFAKWLHRKSPPKLRTASSNPTPGPASCAACCIQLVPGRIC